MPLEIHADGFLKGVLPDQPWALPDGAWNELYLTRDFLVSVRWDMPPGVATFDNCTLGPDARSEEVPLNPGETIELTYGEIDPKLMGLFNLSLPVVKHVVTLRRTSA